MVLIILEFPNLNTSLTCGISITFSPVKMFQSTESQQDQQCNRLRNTHQSLLDKQTEDDGISNFPEGLEDLSPQIWILDHVIQLGMIVTKDSCSHDEEKINYDRLL